MPKTFDDDPPIDNNVYPEPSKEPAFGPGTSYPAEPAFSPSPLSSISDKEPWMKSYWRPSMAWLYLTVCAFDFIVAPMLWAGLQFWRIESITGQIQQWQPLTLQGAGLFHMAMGAVLGITAWGRTQEKNKGLN